MIITINSKICIPLADLRPGIADDIKARLTFKNPAYGEALGRLRAMGKINAKPYNIPETIIGWSSSGGDLILPRGCTAETIGLLHSSDWGRAKIDILNKTRKLPEVDFKFHGQLKPAQEPAVKAILERKFSTISSPTGSGKTVMGLYVISQRKQPTLVAVHTTAIMKQWVERAETFLRIPRSEIGIIGQGNKTVGRRLTIALVQTLRKCAAEIAPRIGHLIVDECFPYNTMVKTNKGEIKIGEIVEKKLSVKVLTFNLANNVIEYKLVNHHIINQQIGSLVRIRHQFGELICTPNHKLWTKESGYVRADQTTGKTLQFLQSEPSYAQNKSLLQQRMCQQRALKDLENKKRRKAIAKDLRVLPQSIYTSLSKTTFLQPPVCKYMENVCTRNTSQDAYPRETKKIQSVMARKKESTSIRTNEVQKSNAQSRNCRKDETNQAKNRDLGYLDRRKRRQQQTHPTASNPCQCLTMASGGCNHNRPKITLSTQLQGGYRLSGIKNSHRGGWERTPFKRSTSIGLQKRSLSIGSRVDSIEILEQGNKRKSQAGTGRSNSIYNIEVQGNHNYFAEGILVSNCHHTPASTFTEAITPFDCSYSLGLSATHRRRDGLTALIYWYVGPLVYETPRSILIRNGDIIQVEPVIRETAFIPSPNIDPVWQRASLMRELTTDENRNIQIARDVIQESYYGPCIVLSDRKVHCEILAELIGRTRVQVEVATGDVPRAEQEQIISAMNSGRLQVLVATGQLLGEGFDCKRLTALFLATPIKFSGRLIQYLGRVARSSDGKTSAKVYDYHDVNVPVLMRAARERMRTYKKLARQDQGPTPK